MSAVIAPAGPVAETVAGPTGGAPPGGRRRALLGAAGAAGGAAGALLLAACAGPAAGTSGAAGPSGGEASGPPLNLKVWGPPPATEPGVTMARQLVERGQARPRLKVELEPVQTAGTDVTKAVALLAAGTGPDVFYLGRWLTAQFAAYRTIAAIDRYVTRAAKTLPLADYYPRFVAESRWRGALYGLPYVTTTRGLFYNQGHFQEAGLPADRPPATWEQLDQASARLLGRGPDGQLTRVGYVAGAGNPGTYLGWMVYLWQLGGDVLAADNKRVAPDLVRLGGQALETMAAQIQRNGGWAAIEALTTGAPLPQGADLFSSGRCSMLFHQQQQVLAYDRVSGLKYGVAPFPLPPGGKRVNFAAGPNLALFGGTKQPDAAWEIVEYLSEDGRLTAFNVAGGSMPPRRSAAQSKDYLALHPTMRFFADEQEVGRWVPIVPGIQDMFFALDETVTPAIKGQLAPRDAVEQASARLTAILKQNEAYL